MLIVAYNFKLLLSREPLRLTPALVLFGVGVLLFIAIVGRLIIERRRPR